MMWRYESRKVDPDSNGQKDCVWDCYRNAEAPVGRFPHAQWAASVASNMNTADAIARETCPAYAEMLNKKALGRAKVE